MNQTDAIDLVLRLSDRVRKEKNHACYEHEYMTDEKLMQRVILGKQSGKSCFNKDIDIQGVICDMLESSGDIIKWLRDVNSDKYLQIEEEMPNCGRKYLRSKNHNWEDGAITCDKVILILVKDTDLAGGVERIDVVTCYPS